MQASVVSVALFLPIPRSTSPSPIFHAVVLTLNVNSQHRSSRPCALPSIKATAPKQPASESSTKQPYRVARRFLLRRGLPKTQVGRQLDGPGPGHFQSPRPVPESKLRKGGRELEGTSCPPHRTGCWGQSAARKWGCGSARAQATGAWVRFSVFHSFSSNRPPQRISATPSSLTTLGVSRCSPHTPHPTTTSIETDP